MEEQQRRRHTSDQQSRASGVSIAKSLWKRVKEENTGIFLGENIIWKEVWKQGEREIKKLSGIWAGREKQWHFNCFLRDLALASDFRPTPAFIMMHFSPQNNSWHLLTWAPCLHLLLLSFLFAHHLSISLSLALSLSSSLSQQASLARLGTDGRIQQMFYQAVFFFRCFFSPFLSFPFSASHSLISAAAEWI